MNFLNWPTKRHSEEKQKICLKWPTSILLSRGSTTTGWNSYQILIKTVWHDEDQDHKERRSVYRKSRDAYSVLVITHPWLYTGKEHPCRDSCCTLYNKWATVNKYQDSVSSHARTAGRVLVHSLSYPKILPIRVGEKRSPSSPSPTGSV